jgi:hypothetical protein
MSTTGQQISDESMRVNATVSTCGCEPSTAEDCGTCPVLHLPLVLVVVDVVVPVASIECCFCHGTLTLCCSSYTGDDLCCRPVKHSCCVCCYLHWTAPLVVPMSCNSVHRSFVQKVRCRHR